MRMLLLLFLLLTACEASHKGSEAASYAIAPLVPAYKLDGSQTEQNAWDVSVPDGRTAPEAVSENGHKLLRFSGGNSLQISGGSLSLADEFTLSLVVRPMNVNGRIASFGAAIPFDEGGLNWQGHFQAVHATNASNYTLLETPAANELQIVMVAFGRGATSAKLIVNGREVRADFKITGSPGDFGFIARDLILAPSISASAFDLGELQLFTRALTGRELAGLTQFLSAKWNIPVQIDIPLEGPARADTIHFAEISAAILQPRCVQCHNSTTRSGGVDLTSYSAVLTTVRPGQPDASILYSAVNTNFMPASGGPLSLAQKELLKNWIAQGANQ